MWNLLAGNLLTAGVYRPTTSSGTMTNPTYAYDADDYPWLTGATTTGTGSTTPGTFEDRAVIYSGFPTLSKSAFSTIDLSIVLDLAIYPLSVGGAGGYLISGAFVVQTSYNGGSSWTDNLVNVGTSYFDGLGAYNKLYPATDVAAVTDINSAIGYTMSKNTISATIPSSVLSVGAQSLQVKFITSTLTSTRSGAPASSCYYKVWDIRAVVS